MALGKLYLPNVLPAIIILMQEGAHIAVRLNAEVVGAFVSSDVSEAHSHCLPVSEYRCFQA